MKAASDLSDWGLRPRISARTDTGVRQQSDYDVTTWTDHAEDEAILAERLKDTRWLVPIRNEPRSRHRCWSGLPNSG